MTLEWGNACEITEIYKETFIKRHINKETHLKYVLRTDLKLKLKFICHFWPLNNVKYIMVNYSLSEQIKPHHT